MDIIWAYDMVGECYGNALGYYYAQQGQKEALKKLGVNFSLDSKIAFHHVPPHLYQHIPGVYNYVYTMYEAYDLPKRHKQRLETADRIGVPSEFIKEIFERAGLKQQIDVIPHGIDSDLFEYKERDPKQNLRFLWLGAPNYRKGCDLVCKAFARVFKPSDPVELMIKTTVDNQAGDLFMVVREKSKETKKFVKSFLDDIQGFEMIPYKKVKFDSRKLPIEEIVKLYQEAHCFVFPSRGEGFGFTAAEAMSTGAVVITSEIGGQREFCNNETACLVPCEMQWDVYYGETRHRCYVPKVDEIAKQMVWVYNNWKEAQKKAKTGADLIREKFTWDRCGKKLLSIFEEINGSQS